MVALPRVLKISRNPQLIDKNLTGDNRLYVEGFENVELTVEQLAASVRSGVAHCVQLKGRRSAVNFLASDVACVDIDAGLTIPQALESSLVRDHAALLYTTASHRVDRHRFRVVFALPRTIVVAAEMRAIQRSLALRLGADPAAVDAARIFFGNRNARVWLPNRQMSLQLLNELIAQSVHAGQGDEATGGRRAPSRVFSILRPETVIRLANGGTVPLSQALKGASAFCPFHRDDRPSAFVVESRASVKAVHCSTCASTFWPADASAAAAWDFSDFERAAEAARARYQLHGDPGFLGPFFDPPEERTNLTKCNITIVSGAPAPPELKPGLTLIKAPKGSGKTEALRGLCWEARSVLLIGHRRSLIRHSCARLGLVCYLDVETSYRYAPHDRYGICLDSILKIPPDAGFDVVILDESEQVLGHVLADTLERSSGGGRDRIFKHLSALVGSGRRVVALDADLGWGTFTPLQRIIDANATNHRGPRPTHLWIDQRKPGVGKTVEIYLSKGELAAELRAAVGDGKKCFVAANSKKLAAEVAAIVAHDHPDTRILLVTADTASEAASKAFFSNPARAMYEYDVVLTSPAVGTGVDISFPNGAQVVDIVFGFCEPLINTHLDFDQQIGRVRNPAATKVYVSGRRFHFESNVEVVKRDILEQSLFKNMLEGYRQDGTAIYVEHDPLIELASLELAKQRASKNDLFGNFVRLKEEQGFKVELVAPRGGGVVLGRGLNDRQYEKCITEAPVLRRARCVQVGEDLEGGLTVSAADVAAYHRTKMELFYREPATVSLIKRDRRGRYRTAFRLFKWLQRELEYVRGGDKSNEVTRFLRSDARKVALILRALKLTPLLRQDDFDPEAVIEKSDLAGFALFAQEEKQAIETQLGTEVRRDVIANPVQQLSSMLRPIGLSLVRAGTAKREGEKIYRYRLNSTALEHMRALDRVRSNGVSGWEALYTRLGWIPDDDDIREEERTLQPPY